MNLFEKTPVPADAVLSLRGLVKRFDQGGTSVIAVNGVSADIRGGELVALVGPSGCGKSTLLLMAGLIEQPTDGEVRVRGWRIRVTRSDGRDLRDFRRRNIGFVFQKPNLIPFLSARENVQIALEINGTPARTARTEARRLLEFLGTGHRADSLPKTLSGGEQQRVAVARALANRPALILADEPTAALDSRRGRQVVELFRQVTRELATAILMVTHDTRHLDLFDRIIEMNDGQISERKTAEMPGHV
jgi:putative ABC transport system ATP-binding protein